MIDSSTTKVKLCDVKITADQIKTSWQSNGSNDWYEVKIIDKTKTRTQKQAKQLGQQILEVHAIVNRLIKEHDDLTDFVETNDGCTGMMEFKHQLALLRRILTTFDSGESQK